MQETDTPNDATEEIAVQEEEKIPQDQDSPPNEYLMHISAHAVSGLVTAGTFSVKVTVGGQTGIALIDTGSSSTFIDLSFAVKTTCHIQKKNSAKIAVAGGGQLTSGAIIADTAFSIQKHAFNNTLRVLDLKEYDVILGCDWLYKHSPFALNLKTREFLITLEDDTLLSLKDCTSQDAYTEVATEQMNKLLNKGISGFILHLNSLSLQAPHSSAPPAISALLQQYSEVFQEPTTLPPHRDIDHAIPLQEGATPPNIRPYRVPHKQKDEMEHQIQQLLKNKVIRHSQSPFPLVIPIATRTVTGPFRHGCVPTRRGM